MIFTFDTEVGRLAVLASDVVSVHEKDGHSHVTFYAHENDGRIITVKSTEQFGLLSTRWNAALRF